MPRYLYFEDNLNRAFDGDRLKTDGQNRQGINSSRYHSDAILRKSFSNGKMKTVNS